MCRYLSQSQSEKPLFPGDSGECRLTAALDAENERQIGLSSDKTFIPPLCSLKNISEEEHSERMQEPEGTG